MISENIKILRRINSLNQKNFAKAIGVSIKTPFKTGKTVLIYRLWK